MPVPGGAEGDHPGGLVSHVVGGTGVIVYLGIGPERDLAVGVIPKGGPHEKGMGA